MTLTNFPDGISSFGVPVGGMFTNGKPWFVKPGTGAGGNDGNTGDAVDVPLATLATALTKIIENRNDVVYMLSSSPTLANTTDFQSATLDWKYSGTHLIGINSGNRIAMRSRIGVLSTATAASVTPVFKVSASNCLIQNVHVFNDIVSATAMVGVEVSGNRNHFVNCHFAGIGDNTQDLATACSLKLSGSENFFENCTIGLDTITRDTATYEIVLPTGGAATRNHFKDCTILTNSGAANTSMTFLTVQAGGIDRFCLFENCTFINAVSSGAVEMTGAISMAASGGMVVLRKCAFIGSAHSEASSSGYVYHDASTGVKGAVAAV
jgi:hypothetical protein